jgi:hypothetical protein
LDSVGGGTFARKYTRKTNADVMTMELPFIRRKGSLQISIPEEILPTMCLNEELIRALVKAFKYQKKMTDNSLSLADLAFEEEIDAGYLGRLLRLTCLAPDIIKSILAGTQPPTLILQTLIRQDVPPIWSEQRKIYNFPAI